MIHKLNDYYSLRGLDFYNFSIDLIFILPLLDELWYLKTRDFLIKSDELILIIFHNSKVIGN